MSKTRTVIIVTAAILVSGYVGYSIKPNDTSQASFNLYKLWVDVNNERIATGKPQLLLDQNVVIAAQAKCQDMQAKQYWGHYAPDGKAWIQFITDNTDATIGGENLSSGYYTPESVTNAWMNSPDHRANVLNSHFTRVGYAVCSGINGYPETIVQEFVEL